MLLLMVDEHTVVMLQGILSRETIRLMAKQKRGDLHEEDIAYIEDLKEMLEDLESLGEIRERDDG